MTLPEVFLSQISDPFRLGLIVALVLVTFRTRAVTGHWIPLAAGVIFVAVLLPLTTARGMAEGAFSQAVAIGIAANLVLLGVVLAIRHFVLKVMP